MISILAVPILTRNGSKVVSGCCCCLEDLCSTEEPPIYVGFKKINVTCISRIFSLFQSCHSSGHEWHRNLHNLYYSKFSTIESFTFLQPFTPFSRPSHIRTLRTTHPGQGAKEFIWKHCRHFFLGFLCSAVISVAWCFIAIQRKFFKIISCILSMLLFSHLGPRVLFPHTFNTHNIKYWHFAGTGS